MSKPKYSRNIVVSICSAVALLFYAWARGWWLLPAIPIGMWFVFASMVTVDFIMNGEDE